MIKITWDNIPHTTKSKSFIADIGDIRIILKEQQTKWLLEMGIRVYTKDHSSSMVRPPVTLTTFDKPCSLDDAKELTAKYLDTFFSSIFSAVEVIDNQPI